MLTEQEELEHIETAAGLAGLAGTSGSLAGVAGLAVQSTNPKDRLGIKKVPMGQVPPVAIAHESCAMLDGDLKYGYRNWREKKVSAKIYVDACIRHLYSWLEGEEVASDSGVHHLGHARACLGILLDAQASDKLVDDRVKGAFPEVAAKLSEWVKKRIENATK